MTVKAPGAGPVPDSGTGPYFPASRSARALAITDIVVSETIGGVRVTQRLALGRFAGVLAEESAGDQTETEIALLRNDGLTIFLATATDEDVVALWRAESRRFSRPMIFRTARSKVVRLESMFGPLMRGKSHPGCRLGALTRARRPRFLMRRKTARLPPCPIVHRPGDAARFS